MAVTYPTTNPTRDLTARVLLVDPIEVDDAQSVIQRQHFAHGRRRLTLAAADFSYDGVGATGGYAANTITPGNPYRHTPVTCDLETCDDFGANVTVRVYVRMKVTNTGAAGAGVTGTVRARVYHGGGSTTIDVSYAHDAAGAGTLTWRSNTGAVPKQDVVGVALFLFVGGADVRVECTGWLVHIDPQSAIA